MSVQYTIIYTLIWLYFIYYIYKISYLYNTQVYKYNSFIKQAEAKVQGALWRIVKTWFRDCQIYKQTQNLKTEVPLISNMHSTILYLYIFKIYYLLWPELAKYLYKTRGRGLLKGFTSKSQKIKMATMAPK